jgi:4-amino-4-deoxy-L-arabinose transferase-like glycosyltransferase
MVPAAEKHVMCAKLNHRICHYWLLVTVGCLLFLVNLGAPSLWDVDEGRNSEAAREMMESGNWVVPTFNYELRTDKPALLYWLQILSFRCFGISEFAARLPSALASIVTVLLTYEMARRMFDSRTGLLAGLVLASSIAFAGAAHFANPDALLCLCTMLTMFTFWNSYARGDRLWPALCGVSAALGVLAKGPVGLVLPGTVIILFLLWQKQWRLIFDRRLLIGLALFFLVAGPWYGWVAAETKGIFLREFIIQHNVERFGSPMQKHGGFIFYYPLVLILGLGAWSALVVPACWHAMGKRLEREMPLGHVPASYRFLWLWLVVFLAFFSLANTKLPNYILPVYPALAVLIARFIERWRRGDVAIPRWSIILALTCLATIGVAIVAAMVILSGTVPLSSRYQMEYLGPWASLGVVVILGTVVIGVLVKRGYRLGALATLIGMAVALLAVAAAFAVPGFNVEKSSEPLSRIIRERTQEPDLRLGAFNCFEPSLVFYCHREVIDLDSEEAVLAFLRFPTQVCVVMSTEDWTRMQKQAGQECHALGQARDLYSNQQLVVVTNR